MKLNKYSLLNSKFSEEDSKQQENGELFDNYDKSMKQLKDFWMNEIANCWRKNRESEIPVNSIILEKNELKVLYGPSSTWS
jgi:hypothetical protein